MDGLTKQDEATIREFLEMCLNDGFYAFIIDDKPFLLESKADIDVITAAIQRATPPVIRYRLDQAERALKKFGHRRDLEPALA